MGVRDFNTNISNIFLGHFITFTIACLLWMFTLSGLLRCVWIKRLFRSSDFDNVADWLILVLICNESAMFTTNPPLAVDVKRIRK